MFTTSLSYCPFEGLPISMYGGTMIPPHPPMEEAPGGPVYNGLHNADPAWNPIMKVVSNSADNSDPQQVSTPVNILHLFSPLLSPHCCGFVAKWWKLVVLGLAWDLGPARWECAPESCQLNTRPWKHRTSNKTHTRLREPDNYIIFNDINLGCVQKGGIGWLDTILMCLTKKMNPVWAVTCLSLSMNKPIAC